MALYRGCTLAACQRKRPYRTSRAAKRAARRTMARGGAALNVYRCAWCGSWHVGHVIDHRRAA